MSRFGLERLRWRLENAEAMVAALRTTIAAYRASLDQEPLTVEERTYVETVKGCAEFMLEAEMAKTRLIRVALGEPPAVMPVPTTH